MNSRYYLRVVSLVLALLFAFSPALLSAQDQGLHTGKVRAQYKRLNSLASSMAEARRGGPADGFLAIPNKPWRPIGGVNGLDDPEAVSKGTATMQDYVANGPMTPGVSFQALHNKDNWTPADPSGDVGPNHIVLAVNSNITVFNKNGTVATGGATVRADAIWVGTECYGGSNGDPIILYDEVADRWIAGLVHFSKNLLCLAASAGSDPLGAWHDYVFDFGTQLPDYPKLGLTPDHLVVTAHMFGPNWAGTIFGAIDKPAMYLGQTIDLLYTGGYSYGYLPVDMDGSLTSRNPTFVGTSSNTAYVYEMQNINFATASHTIQFINSIPLTSVDRSVCSATRGQCIVQPASWNVESLDGRLMNRAAMRNYGSYDAMVFSQTINAGSERAGIAWYEIRRSGGNWTKWQQGQYAPNDGKHRWMPSIALNAAGDIGMSFMFSSTTDYPSVAVVGQSATERASASGLFDGNELVCTNGTTPLDPTGNKRSGDYSATVVDPTTDTFWGMQQYAYPGIWADWGVWICEFAVTPASSTNPPTAEFSGSPTSGQYPLNVSFTDLSTDSPTSWSWTFGDGGTSTQQNPSHTYTAAGNYTVGLTATNGIGSDVETKASYIAVTAPPAPVAAFVGTPTSGDYPLNVNFTDQSTNSPTSWSWTFGDGGTSTSQNPSHTYTAEGDYTVTLTATNAGGSDAETKLAYISVTAPVPPPADPTGLLATGTSTSAVHVAWTDNATDEDGYKVDRSANGTSGWGEVASLGANAESFDNTGLSSGTTYYYRTYAYRGTVNSGFSNVDSATTKLPATEDHVASSSAITYGSQSGSYASTHSNAGGANVITESESGGKPSRRTSRMDVVYTIPIRSDVSATFFANTWSSASTDGDEFEFWFSEDGSNYDFMFTVAGGSDDDTYRSFIMGTPSSSTIYVKVFDTDRGEGNRSLDQLSIDHMFIRTELSADPPPAKPTLTATAGGASSADLSWGDVGTETGYRVQRSTDGATYATIVNLAANATNYQDTGLSGGTQYWYRVGAFNAGGTTYSDPKSITTDEAEEVHVGALAGSSSGGKKWTATVLVTVHNAADGSAGSGAQVSGTWGDGGSGSGTCTTTGTGTCSVSKGFKPNVSSVSFTVNNIVKAGATYNSGANETTSVTVSSAASKGVAGGVEIPEALSLDQNYPNPFNPVTIIQYGLPETGHVTVSVYNALGVEVARLQDGVRDAGWYRASFDGSRLSSGIYVAVVRYGGLVRTKTMLLAK